MNALSIVSLVLAMATSAVVAQSVQEIKESKLSIKGTSSLHDWESTVSEIDWSGDITLSENRLTGLANIAVTIPVENIKSEHGRMMDSKTYDAFDSKKNPAIQFKAGSQRLAAQGSSVDVKGSLTMAGVTKPWTLRITYKSLAGGDLQVTGSSKIKMTEFGMDPPTALMGTIKVGDEVTVEFDLILTPDKNFSSRK